MANLAAARRPTSSVLVGNARSYEIELLSPPDTVLLLEVELFRRYNLPLRAEPYPCSRQLGQVCNSRMLGRRSGYGLVLVLSLQKLY